MSMSSRRILVLQTTRMGDMLQTSPLIRLLREKHPSAYIAVMIRRMSLAVAERIPGIDEILIYDEDDTFRQLCRNDSDALIKAYDNVVSYVEQIKQRKFDVAYNCAQSIGSALLLKMAGVPSVIGAHYSSDGQFILRGRWTNYLFTSLRNRTFNDFNLSDVFLNLAYDDPILTLKVNAIEERPRLQFQLTEEDRDAASGLLAAHDISDGDFLACFQLGASEIQKRWPVFRFAALARLLRNKYNAKIVLLGVREEQALGEQYLQLDPGPVVSLFGKTSLGVLGAVLQRAQLLVTNDTGTMHVAAAVGCPTVLVSVGTVHFRETGPYASGNCAVETNIKPDLRSAAPQEKELSDEFRGVLPPEAVALAADIVLNQVDEAFLKEHHDRLQDVLLYRSAFAPDGCLEWYPALPKPFTATDLLRMAYRAMWLNLLTYQEMSPTTIGAEKRSMVAMLTCFRPASDREVLRTETESILTAFREVANLGCRGAVVTEQIIDNIQSGKFVESQQRVRSLMELDEQIRLFGELHPVVKPLTSASAYERNNLEGSDALALAQTTWHIYKDLEIRSQTMLEKIASVLSCYSDVFES